MMTIFKKVELLQDTTRDHVFLGMFVLCLPFALLHDFKRVIAIFTNLVQDKQEDQKPFFNDKAWTLVYHNQEAY